MKELVRPHNGNQAHGANPAWFSWYRSSIRRTERTKVQPGYMLVLGCEHQAIDSLQLLGNPDSFLTESTPLRD